MNNVLIIDKNPIWLKQGNKLLSKKGYQVAGANFSPSKECDTATLMQYARKTINESDVVLIDIDFRQATETLKFLCAIRDSFPRLPIITWTLEPAYPKHDSALTSFGWFVAGEMMKPTIDREHMFVQLFEETVRQQQLLLGTENARQAQLCLQKFTRRGVDWGEIAQKLASDRHERLSWLEEIAKLSETDIVKPTSYPNMESWTIYWPGCNAVKRALTQCLCDGVLDATDIDLHLGKLRIVIDKLEKPDKNFKPIADFIREGNLNALPLIRGYVY